MTFQPWMAAAGVALVLAVAAYVVDRRRRAYADLATSPAAAVFAGRNEVKGRAWAAAPTSAHCTGTPSVWWDYCLEEEREHTRTVTSTDSQGRTQTRTETYRQWHTIDRKASALPVFEVVDRTGSVPVRLVDAKIVARQLHQRTFRRDDDRGFFAKMLDNRTGRYRETECAVAVGDELFVVGHAELDGGTCVPVLARDVLVSTRSEESHTTTLGLAVAALVSLSVLAVLATSVLLVAPDDPGRPAAWAPGVAVAVLALVLAWGVTMHNRLRLVAQGVNRAWSLIDVQLQRRHDLVPALAEVVAASAGHERAALEGLSAGRWTAGRARVADELGREAGEQAAGVRRVLAVAERHPELRSDASFLRLQAELADSENRIAAARTFYNDSLTLLRNRSQSFPGVLVARRLSLEHHDLLAAEGFERTVPAVEHAFT